MTNPSGTVLVAAEFEYEPSHRRPEFKARPGKLPVVFWGSDRVAKDIARITQFVGRFVVPVAFAPFIDEPSSRQPFSSIQRASAWPA
jgi:hypothetical protein